jgi:hypothetical protein
MTVWQDNASLAATQADAYVDMERRAAVREAVALIVGRQPGLAFFKLTRSVQRQARVAGVGLAVIPGCPCGSTHPEQVQS